MTRPEDNRLQCDELDWLAFRYVSNELAETECSAFEARLADDLLAQEAVARAVETTHAVVALMDPMEAAPAVAPHRSHRRQLWWSLAGTLAAVVAVCSAFWMGRHFGDQGDPAGGGNLATHEEPVKPRQPGPKRLVRVSDETALSMIEMWSNSENAVGEDSSSRDGAAGSADSLKPIKIGEPEIVKEGEFDWMIAAVDGSPETNGMKTPSGGKQKGAN